MNQILVGTNHAYAEARKKRRRARIVIGSLIGLMLVGLSLLTVRILQSFQVLDGYNEQADYQPSFAYDGIQQDERSTTKSDAPDDAYLILVNWDHPLSQDAPEDLVSLEEVLGTDLVGLPLWQSKVNRTAGEAARELFLSAKADGIDTFVINSAYRSIEYQNELWQARLNEDPDYGQNPYEQPVKVLPGSMSEHATGLALDILSVDYSLANATYGESLEGKWLANNAHKFGFILRYPVDKESITGVEYEPWHFRYVGVEAAKEMYEQGLCLEEYLQN